MSTAMATARIGSGSAPHIVGIVVLVSFSALSREEWSMEVAYEHLHRRALVIKSCSPLVVQLLLYGEAHG
jgi:hypothetical protein